MKYQLNGITATIEVGEYTRDYRDVEKFIGYCKQCYSYNACWACPPFDFDATKLMANYKNAHIIGTKITLDSTLRNERTGLQQCKDMSYQIIKEVQHELDNKLLTWELQYPDSRVFFAGTCHLCKQGECQRIVGKPCLHSAYIRPSLESLGFDISKTTLQLLKTELKWGSLERLPEYFVLVSGVFTNREIASMTE
jgi:predicted metal-binding protein